LSKTRSSREPSGASVRIGLSLRVAMSCRVSVPTTARLIGLAQPPRPRSLRTGPRGHFVGVATRVNQPPSSHALVTRVRNLSASILTPAFYTRARLRPGFRLNGHSLRRLRDFAAGTSPMGPYDAFQSALTWPSRAALPPLADRPGLPLPALPVSRTCQPCFMPGRPWAPLPSEVSPRRRRTTLSSRAVLRAVSHLAVPRLRGFQLPVGCVLRQPAFSRRR